MTTLTPSHHSLPNKPVSASRVLSLSVVIPCFNEEESVEQLIDSLACLEKEAEGLAKSRGDQLLLEFVLVDDGSTDRTVEKLTSAQLPEHYRIVCHQANQGIAAAIQTGIKSASYDLVGSIDADCSYDPGDILKMLSRFPADATMAVASPYHPEGGVLNVPAWRLWLSKQASRMYSWVLRQKLHTYTSCFRLYRRSEVAAVKLTNSDFVGIAELVWRLDRSGYKIVEVPAILSTRKYGQSKMKVMRATLKHIALLFRAGIDRLLSPFHTYPKPTGVTTAD